jgi:hypothetical protein
MLMLLANLHKHGRAEQLQPGLFMTVYKSRVMGVRPEKITPCSPAAKAREGGKLCRAGSRDVCAEKTPCTGAGAAVKNVQGPAVVP